jgi:hypothetical protein
VGQSLRDLGVQLPLGHNGDVCLFRRPRPSPVTILHSNGMHAIDIIYCNCPGAPIPRIQLLRARLWPATLLSARTAATFELLRLFHTADHRAHVNVTDFYRSLELMTDGVGLHVMPVSNSLRVRVDRTLTRLSGWCRPASCHCQTVARRKDAPPRWSVSSPRRRCVYTRRGARPSVPRLSRSFA